MMHSTGSHGVLAQCRRPCTPIASARHPDYIKLREDPLRPAVVQERPNLEADVRYRRVDFSAELQQEARVGFASCLAAGEAQLELARAALLIAAEDDAIASSSTVPFPVDAFMQRITRLATDTAQLLAAAASEHQQQQQQQAPQEQQIHPSSSSSGPWASLRAVQPHELIEAIEHCLFKQTEQQQQQQQQQEWLRSPPSAGFCTPHYGRSNMPRRALVDHAGVWEDARLAYLNEVLVKRRGCPAALTILYCEVLRQLLLMGAVNFTVTFDYRNFSHIPHAQPLANFDFSRHLLLQQQQQQQADLASSSGSSSGSSSMPLMLLNTCSSEALAELLRHLKRSYWPFPWDSNIDNPEDAGGRGSLGGFRAAAKAALNSDELPAALRAVSATAAHRLSRGIFTSAGAGDLNRCVAAAERLVMMVGDEQPHERRDLAVLLLHAGQPAAAAAELAAFMDDARRGSTAQHVDPFDARLVEDLWKMIRDSGIKPCSEVLTVDTVLRGGTSSRRTTTAAATAAAATTEVYKPLTW